MTPNRNPGAAALFRRSPPPPDACDGIRIRCNRSLVSSLILVAVGRPIWRDHDSLISDGRVCALKITNRPNSMNLFQYKQEEAPRDITESPSVILFSGPYAIRRHSFILPRANHK